MAKKSKVETSRSKGEEQGRKSRRQHRQRGGVAAIYARYSTRFQDSVGDQIRECREWAEENGYRIPEEYFLLTGPSAVVPASEADWPRCDR